MSIQKYVRTVKRNFRCGLWSGYPKCCVLWHTFVFSPFEYSDLFLGPSKSKTVQQFAHKYLSGDLNRDLGRISCPKCSLTGQKVQIKRCHRHSLCQG